VTTASDLSVHVEGVSKRYVKYEDTPTLVGHALRLRSRLRDWSNQWRS